MKNNSLWTKYVKTLQQQNKKSTKKSFPYPEIEHMKYNALSLGHRTN